MCTGAASCNTDTVIRVCCNIYIVGRGEKEKEREKRGLGRGELGERAGREGWERGMGERNGREREREGGREGGERERENSSLVEHRICN